MKHSISACFLLGSNLGNRMDYLQQASEALSLQIGSLVAFSGVYTSTSWGYKSGSNYLNQAILIETGLPPIAILEKIEIIETNLGRKRTGKQYTDRTIDIDILFYGQQVIEEPGLSIPHPRMHLRRFALVPLEEIASWWIHPLLNKPVGEMLADCPDVSEVIPWSDVRRD